MVETMVMVVHIGMVEIIGSEIGKTSILHQKWQEEHQVMSQGEALIMIQDRRRTLDFERVVTLTMKMMMIRKDGVDR
ncbi:hypothetical protein GW17_00048227 [Ensete ventricosum]|nr:hypothetical protein GW17_00048227 [Ensete ventricosum]